LNLPVENPGATYVFAAEINSRFSANWQAPDNFSRWSHFVPKKRRLYHLQRRTARFFDQPEVYTPERQLDFFRTRFPAASLL
jgi:hypothetical protein